MDFTPDSQDDSGRPGHPEHNPDQPFFGINNNNGFNPLLFNTPAQPTIPMAPPEYQDETPSWVLNVPPRCLPDSMQPGGHPSAAMGLFNNGLGMPFHSSDALHMGHAHTRSDPSADMSAMDMSVINQTTTSPTAATDVSFTDSRSAQTVSTSAMGQTSPTKRRQTSYTAASGNSPGRNCPVPRAVRRDARTNTTGCTGLGRGQPASQLDQPFPAQEMSRNDSWETSGSAQTMDSDTSFFADVSAPPIAPALPTRTPLVSSNARAPAAKNAAKAARACKRANETPNTRDYSADVERHISNNRRTGQACNRCKVSTLTITASSSLLRALLLTSRSTRVERSSAIGRREAVGRVSRPMSRA